MEIILASQSPRRRELLKMIGLNYTAVNSEIEEIVPDGVAPGELVKALALQKAKAVFLSYPDACVIGADTIVYIDNEIIGKPADTIDAARILNKLQGRTHTVYTGMAVLTWDREDVRCSTTKVTFAKMTEREIEWYVKTGEPLDKAGAYGVQGPGGVFVEKVDGNYFTAVGMDLRVIYDMLVDAGALVI